MGEKYLTGDVITPTDFICRRLFIPNDLNVIMAVNGAILALTKPFLWEQLGIATPQQSAAYMAEMFDDYLKSECVMIGSMMPYAGLNPPAGTLPCDGGEYAREQYPQLYEYLIDSPYIVDADTFTTPIFEGRTIVQPSEDIEVYSEFGEVEHELTTDELTPHSHNSPPHAHSEVTAVPTIINGGLEAPASAATPGAGTTGATAVTIDSTGNGQPFPLFQPSVAFNWCIVAGRYVENPTPPPESFILFGSGEPDLPDLVSDGDDYWLGVRLQAMVSGHYTAIRFYKDATSSGTYRGQIWDDSNVIVAGADFVDSASGWQEVAITPVHTPANTTFTIGVHFPTGEFRRRLHAFDSTYEDYPFRIVGGGENGVYVLVSFGGGDNRPRFVFDNSDYGVSVVFEPD